MIKLKKFALILCGVLAIPLLVGSVHAKKAPLEKKKTVAVEKKVVAESAPAPSSTSTDQQIDIVAKQAILVDYETGTVLLEKNADELMHPSSMTKIMTTYLVLEKIKDGIITLDTLVLIGRNAWRVEGSSMFLNIDTTVRVEDLLKGLIIQSGNDAGIALAEKLSGSEAVFAQEMTRRAHELGATHTNFLNSSGLPHPQHLTTARDLVILALHTINDHPSFYHLHSEKDFTYGGIKQGNRNPLLYKNIGCDGLKTGHTQAGGFGMVASCVQDGHRLILVINGLSSMQARSDEAVKLINWGMMMYSNYTIYKEGQIVDTVPVWVGKENKLPVTVQKTIIVTLPRASQKDMKVSIDCKTPITAPIKEGQVVGKVIVSAPSLKENLEFPLVAAVTIEKAGIFKRIKDSISHLIWGKS